MCCIKDYVTCFYKKSEEGDSNSFLLGCKVLNWKAKGPQTEESKKCQEDSPESTFDKGARFLKYLSPLLYCCWKKTKRNIT